MYPNIIPQNQKIMEKSEKIAKRGKNALIISFKYYIIDGYKINT